VRVPAEAGYISSLTILLFGAYGVGLGRARELLGAAIGDSWRGLYPHKKSRMRARTPPQMVARRNPTSSVAIVVHSRVSPGDCSTARPLNMHSRLVGCMSGLQAADRYPVSCCGRKPRGWRKGNVQLLSRHTRRSFGKDKAMPDNQRVPCTTAKLPTLQARRGP
jgi:hypothetical protein